MHTQTAKNSGLVMLIGCDVPYAQGGVLEGSSFGKGDGWGRGNKVGTPA
jgi:KxxxW-cyclized secreted peptide